MQYLDSLPSLVKINNLNREFRQELPSCSGRVYVNGSDRFDDEAI